MKNKNINNSRRKDEKESLNSMKNYSNPSDVQIDFRYVFAVNR